MFNKYWFRRFYTTEFIQVVRYYAESLRTKVVPSFDNISDEAALVEKETVDRLGQHFDPDRDDPPRRPPKFPHWWPPQTPPPIARCRHL